LLWGQKMYKKLLSTPKLSESLSDCGQVDFVDFNVNTRNLAKSLDLDHRIQMTHLKFDDLISYSQLIKTKVSKLKELIAKNPPNPKKLSNMWANWHMTTGKKDGVSIVIDHIERILKKCGLALNINRFTGEEGDKKHELKGISTVIKDLSLSRNKTQSIKKRLTMIRHLNLEEELKLNEEMLVDAGMIYDKLLDHFIKHPQEIPDISIIHNFFSLPVHPTATIALYNLFRDLGLPLACIHHDFFETRKRFKNTRQFKFFKKYFKPSILKDLDNVYHFTINQRDQKRIHEEQGINSVVIYNPDDFSHFHTFRNKYIAKFKNILWQKYQVPLNAGLIVQGTRTVSRKKIQIAIELIARYNQRFPENPHYLLCFGNVGEDQEGTGYYEFLKEVAEEKNCSQFIKFIGENLNPKDEDDLKKEKFSFATIYQAADGFTYFSEEEGFGNNLLEGIKYGVNSAIVWNIASILDLSKDKKGKHLTPFTDKGNRILMENLKKYIEENLKDIDSFKKSFPDKYIKLMSYIKERKELLPILGMTGGGKFSYEIYKDEIKKVGVNLLEVSEKDIKLAGLSQVNELYFSNYELINEKLIEKINYYLNDPQGQLENLIQAISNFIACHEHYSYERVGKIMSDHIVGKDIHKDKTTKMLYLLGYGIQVVKEQIKYHSKVALSFMGITRP